MRTPTIPVVLNRLLRAIDFDQAVLWGVSGKVFAAFVGPVTAVLIAYYFSPELQGYHYTFLSLAALQIFVELGLSGVITTFASHEWAKLTWSKSNGIEGDPEALSRLASLTLFSLRWFVTAAVALILLLVVVGFIFLSVAPSLEHQVAWQGPWIGLCVVTGINLMLVPVWAILQGCGQIKNIYSYRFTEAVLRAMVMWIALLIGVGLWAVVIASCVALLWASNYLWSRYGSFFSSLRYIKTLEPIVWKRDILPLQWRIALGWMGGYFMFSLFTPALFYFQGPVVAGQMGMTWALISGVSGLAGTWLQVKVPEFGLLVAQRNFLLLDRLVYKAGIISFAITCLGAILLFGLLVGLDRYAPELRGRLLPMLPIALFMIAEVLHQISFAQSSYLRAFKREPFLVLSLVSSLTVGISTIISAKYFDASGISVGYLTAVLVAIAWGTRIFVRCRREWIC